MEIKDALEYAQILKGAIVRDIGWGINTVGATVCENYTSKILMYSEDSRQFMSLLLNTFIDVHNSLSKTLEEDEDLRDAYIKYGEPFVHALQKSAEEHSHNFVQQWLDQHENDENNHLIDFGPANNEPKEHAVEIDPVSENPIDNDPKESEEDIPQIVINIGELNVNFPTEDPKGFLAAVATPKNDPTEDDDKPSEEDMCDVVLEKCGNNSLLFAEQVNALLMDKTPFSIVAKLVTFLPSIIGNVPKREAEKFKQQAERTGAKVSIYELGTYNRVHPVHLHR